MSNVHANGHFEKFKIKTTLKTTKNYQEDIIEFEKELERLGEEKYEIKDKFGRVMNLKNKGLARRKPNTSRRPKKRPPLRKL